MGNGNFLYFNSLHNFLREFHVEREVAKSGMLWGQIEVCSPALLRNSSHSASCKEQSYFKLNFSTFKVSHWKCLFALTCSVKRNGKEISHFTCCFPPLTFSASQGQHFSKEYVYLGIHFLFSRLTLRCWQHLQEVFLCRATDTSLEWAQLVFAFLQHSLRSPL